jgi:hypothetical protein
MRLDKAFNNHFELIKHTGTVADDSNLCPGGSWWGSGKDWAAAVSLYREKITQVTSFDFFPINFHQPVDLYLTGVFSGCSGAQHAADKLRVASSALRVGHRLDGSLLQHISHGSSWNLKRPSWRCLKLKKKFRFWANIPSDVNPHPMMAASWSTYSTYWRDGGKQTGEMVDV